MSVDVAAADGLLARTAALVPMLRARAAETEAARRVSPASLDALSDAGVFRMMAPKRYGGAEADFQTQSDVLATIARGCPSTSWVATIYSAMAWVAGVFPDEAQDEVFAERRPPDQRRLLSDRHGGAPGWRVRRQRPLAVQHRMPRI